MSFKKILNKVALVFSFIFLVVSMVSCNKEVKLTLTADKTLAFPGEVVTLNTTIESEKEVTGIVYEITKGQDLASVDTNGKLTILESAINGGEVSVVSKYETYTSNSISIDVGINVTEILASANKYAVDAGEAVILTAKVLPENATDKQFSWEFVEGSDYAVLSGNGLIINESAKSDNVVKLKAVCGNVSSNTLTFTVNPTQEEINKQNLMLSLSKDEIQVDKNGDSSPVLSVTIYDANLEEVTNKQVKFEIVSGSEFISLNPNGYDCTFTVLGHGEAVVRASIEGTSIYEEATIKTIVPPSGLKLHDVFTERTGFNYNFSKVDELYFPIETIGENVSETYSVTFKDALNNTGSDVATYNYETSKIKFNKTGLITVNVISTSGSKLETSTSYTFNVNDGINVYSFEQLKSTVSSETYNGQTINVVVLERPTTEAYDYEYGYDLVPSFALKAENEQTFNDIYSGKGHIYAYNKNLVINGNHHAINESQVRVLTEAEFNENAVNDDQAPSIVEAYSSASKTYQVKLNDLSVIGNCSIDYQGELDGKRAIGVISRGVVIGNSDTLAACYLEMKNVNVSGFYAGMRICHVVNNGLVENVSVYNCFSNGIESYGNEITFKNMNYGKCGAAGIELCPEAAYQAGVNFNKAQTVTFAGKIITDNYNKGDTIYMNNFTAMGIPVYTILQGVLQAYPKEVLSNVMTSEGQFVFISFIFNQIDEGVLNPSVINYEDIDGAGIVNINNLTGVNTTHKYIELDVVVPALGGSAGRVLLYNVNYQG